MTLVTYSKSALPITRNRASHYDSKPLIEDCRTRTTSLGLIRQQDSLVEFTFDRFAGDVFKWTATY